MLVDRHADEQCRKKRKNVRLQKATNNSKQTMAVPPNTAAGITPYHNIESAIAAMNPTIIASTRWPANMLAKRRTARMRCLNHKPTISMQEDHRHQNATITRGRSMGGHKPSQNFTGPNFFMPADPVANATRPDGAVTQIEPVGEPAQGNQPQQVAEQE